MFTPRRASHDSRRGAAAAVILTVLLLSILIALTLFELTRLSTPEIPTDAAGTRALMLAHSGIDRALNELPRAASLPTHGTRVRDGEVIPEEFWTYWGEDANQNGTLDPGEDANGNGRLDTVEVPLDAATRPSLSAMDGNTVRSVMVGPRRVGISGAPGPPGAAPLEHFVLRITEGASRIWINGPEEPTRVMLIHLVRRLGLPVAVAGDILNRRRLGNGAQKVNSYRTEEDLIPVIGEKAYQVLAPYITAHAWVDLDTVGRCPFSARIRPASIDELVYSWGDLRPRALELQPRAPVNINSAPAAVLASVFEGVQGGWVDEDARARPRNGAGSNVDWLETTLPNSGPQAALGILRATTPVTAAQAERLASAAIAWRSRAPFRTWQHFRRFLDACIQDGTIDAMQAEALRANADPNTLLNDFNPDANAWSPIDKSDLIAGTTEFCFSSMGTFVVESLGRVLDRSGTVLARRMIKAHVHAWDVWRETTEKQFLRGVREGAEARTQISPYDGEGTTRAGLALEVIPEAVSWEAANRSVISNLYFDGRIGLSTLMIPGSPDTWLRATLTPPMMQSLVADDARVRRASNDPEELRKQELRARQPKEEGEPSWRPLMAAPDPAAPSAMSAAAIGHLFPDGAYLEDCDCLRYRAIDNLPAGRDGETRSGSISFWLKPAFDPRKGARPRTLWSLDRRRTLGAPGTPEIPILSAHLFPPAPGVTPAGGPFSWGYRLDGYLGFGIARKDDARGQQARGWEVAGIATGRNEFAAFRPHGWVHLAFAWDLDKPADRAFRIAINGVLVPPARIVEQVPGTLPLRTPLDLATDGNDETTWISLGALALDPIRNFPLDATVDEIRVGTLEAFETARRDAVEGRYARIDDRARPRRGGASFESAPWRPDGPRVPASIAWTVREAESLPDSAIRLQFWDGERWRGTFDDAGGATLDEGGEIAREVPYRWRAVFTTGARRDEPVNETPYLDDVTIFLTGKPRIVALSSPDRGESAGNPSAAPQGK